MKRFAGWPAYVASGLRHLRDPVMRVRVRIDDGPPMRRLARTVLVGNVGRVQGGLELLLDAEADDGLLDVVVVAPRTLRDWIRFGAGNSPSIARGIRTSNASAAARSWSRPTGSCPGRWTARSSTTAESQRAYRAGRSGRPHAAVARRRP